MFIFNSFNESLFTWLIIGDLELLEMNDKMVIPTNKITVGITIAIIPPVDKPLSNFLLLYILLSIIVSFLSAVFKILSKLLWVLKFLFGNKVFAFSKLSTLIHEYNMLILSVE